MQHHKIRKENAAIFAMQPIPPVERSLVFRTLQYHRRGTHLNSHNDLFAIFLHEQFTKRRYTNGSSSRSRWIQLDCTKLFTSIYYKSIILYNCTFRSIASKTSTLRNVIIKMPCVAHFKNIGLKPSTGT